MLVSFLSHETGLVHVQHIEQTLNSIYSNIVDLNLEAKNLQRRKKFAFSVHLSIACLEECSKYIIVFCKNHLDESVYKKRFQHLTKHRISTSFYYILGQIQVLNVVEIAKERVDEKHKKILETLSGLLSVTIERGTPANTANAILEILSQNKDEAVETQRKKFVSEVEHLRTSSLYVDVANEASIISTPKEIEKSTSSRYLEMCGVSISIINFLRNSEMTGQETISSLPYKIRKTIEYESKQHTEDLLKRLSSAPTPATPSRA